VLIGLGEEAARGQLAACEKMLSAANIIPQTAVPS
jgi:hypothetical protein